MRILVLSKRRYTNLDLLDDRFGRLRELPLNLASMGHQVTGICLSYRPRDEGRRDDIKGDARVDWQALNFQRLVPWGTGNYWQVLRQIGGDFHPDLVWACSDMFHAVLAVPVARKLGSALVVDLYDNFESFPAARLPGLRTVFYRALRQSDGITCASRPLAEHIRQRSNCHCPVEVVENAIPEDFRRPMPKIDCRRKLGLPENAVLIGTAGAISRSRGIATLFRAFEILAQKRSDVHLVLAGARDHGVKMPQSPRVHYLGMLPPKTIPVFLSALDISVICNRASAFGQYCFPQKFYETVACAVPVVVAGTPVMREILKNDPGHLFEPENVESLSAALSRKLENPEPLSIEAVTWPDRANRLEAFFQFVLQGRRKTRRHDNGR